MTIGTHDKKRAVRHWANKILLTTVGAVLYAVSIGFFLDPNHLSAGGVTGIAQIVSQYLPIGTGTLSLLMNIPIMFLGMWKFGVKFFGLTAYALVLSSPLIDLFIRHPLTDDPVLAALAGGALLGVGMGVLFRAGASSGGVDIITKVIRLRFPHVKTGVIFFILDAIIIAASAVVFGDLDIGLYATIGILITTFVMNYVLYGSDEARMVYIISNEPQKTANLLLEQLNLGGTFLNGYGAYTGKEKKVLMCVMRPKQLPAAREVAASVDPGAFLIVAGVSAVFGEGFKAHNAEEL
ncbi:MAG: YitT family protein [Ruminococcaceae bacterium]|nr:YitT family protein [Oscillospiraceae bacterium]